MVAASFFLFRPFDGAKEKKRKEMQAAENGNNVEVEKQRGISLPDVKFDKAGMLWERREIRDGRVQR